MRVRYRAGVTLVLMYTCVALAFVLLGPGCQSAVQQNTAATANTQQTIVPLLQMVATAHPDQATAISTLVANWTTQSERTDYTQSLPYLTTLEADRPDLAGAVKDKIYTWDKRLTAMGQ